MTRSLLGCRRDAPNVQRYNPNMKAMSFLVPVLCLLGSGQPERSDWMLLRVPGPWEEAQGGRFTAYDGFAWYRCFVRVPAAWKGDDLALTVHKIDNCHEAFFNGVRIGGQGEFPPRYRNGFGDRPVSYTVPARHVRTGELNVIAFRIYDKEGKGGFRGAPPILSNEAQAIALRGDWLFRTGDDRRWAVLWQRPTGNQAVFAKVENAATLARNYFSARDDARPLSPQEALRRFRVPDDLVIEQVLAEPTVKQPVFVNFDERGRMWVVQYLQYPHPAGLKIVSRDAYWRNVYDKIPLPPPRHVHGKDKITIHEDTNGDGIYDRHTTFMDGLNIATAVERGRGGVWVLNPPYLLFYPDRNNDDVPDGDPVVHLQGFGLEDTHSVVNSLCWGPDGWLYGAQGSTVTGHVSRPGDKTVVHSMGQLIWRYHPEKHLYEIFAEGGGNAFGVEIDAKGRIYSGHNGGNTRGFHYVQGGYYQKGFSKHGPISNPYAFGYFPAMRHPNTPRFTHTFTIYDAAGLPPRYRGKLFAVAPLQNHVVESSIGPDGSSFQTRDVEHVVTTSDTWFRPVDIKIGPDAALYIADWYDGQVNHYRNHEGQIDATNGRVYRLRARDARPFSPRDLSKLTMLELIDLLRHENRWMRRTALRLIGDRKDRTCIPYLADMLRKSVGQTALEALWALNLSGGFDDTIAREALHHSDPYVRLWTVRLLGDERKISGTLAAELAKLAEREPHVEVRAQLACSARRLPAAEGLPIVRRLLEHREDMEDIHIPLLLWWAIETWAESDRQRVLSMCAGPDFWRLPMVQKHIIERLMRRYTQAGGHDNLLACTRLLQLAPDVRSAQALLAGFETALAGRSLAGLPDELVKSLGQRGRPSLALQLRLGNKRAIAEAHKIVADRKADRKQRLALIGMLGEIRDKTSVPILLELLSRPSDDELHRAALAALSPFDDPAIAGRVLELYPRLSPDGRNSAQAMFAGRKSWTRYFLEAVAAAKIDAKSVPLDMVRKMTMHRDEHIAALVHKIWGQVRGATTLQMQKEIEHWQQVLRQGEGSPYAGKKIFQATCARCHVLFGQGGNVGPDLTTYKRDDVATMLLNVVNPSAEIREGFETHVVATSDGRVLTGFLIDREQGRIVLRTAEGQDVSVAKRDIEEMRVDRQSIMPEGLLSTMSAGQVRNLFAYLRSGQPLND
jgi:putative membrane-bound dehydrogenase-like protein